VPKEVTFKTKPAIALEQLRWASAAGLPRGVVLMEHPAAAPLRSLLRQHTQPNSKRVDGLGVLFCGGQCHKFPSLEEADDGSGPVIQRQTRTPRTQPQ
jgi:hypothetical protein